MFESLCCLQILWKCWPATNVCSANGQCWSNVSTFIQLDLRFSEWSFAVLNSKCSLILCRWVLTCEGQQSRAMSNLTMPHRATVSLTHLLAVPFCLRVSAWLWVHTHTCARTHLRRRKAIEHFVVIRRDESPPFRLTPTSYRLFLCQYVFLKDEWWRVCCLFVCRGCKRIWATFYNNLLTDL